MNQGFIVMSNKEFGGVLAQFPFVFEISIEKMKENLKILRKYNFSSPQIHRIVKKISLLV